MMDKKTKQFTDDLIKIVFKNGKILGYDQYNNCQLEYAECYAKLLISLYYKYKTYKENFYKDQAAEYIEYMLSLSKETKEYIYWGLPYNWGNTTTCDGFIITTAFCLKSLYLWYSEGVFKEKDKIRKSINWCMSLYTENGECGLFYSNKLNKNIYNATSITCGVLALTKEFMSDDEMKCIDKIMGSLVNVQKNGYWNYSLNKVDVDLLHQCYTCEGMFEYLHALNDEKVLNSVIKGVDFITSNIKFLNIERYFFKLSDPENFKTRIKHLLLKIYCTIKRDERRCPKTRAWSYAAYIRTLIHSYIFTNNSIYRYNLENTIEYVNENILKNHTVLFKAGVSDTYVRNTYHMLEALCYYECFMVNGEV